MALQEPHTKTVHSMEIGHAANSDLHPASVKQLRMQLADALDTVSRQGQVCKAYMRQKEATASMPADYDSNELCSCRKGCIILTSPTRTCSYC